MRYFSSQQKKGIIFFIGCIVIPLLIFIPLLYFGINRYNITGLLNLKEFRIPFHVVTFFLLIWMNYLLYRISRKRTVPGKILIPLDVLTIFALLIPYREGMSALDTLHITTAYLAFAFFSILFIDLFLFNQKYLSIFVMTSILCLFLCLTAGKVTGLSEAIFGSLTSILLTLSAI